MYRKLLTRGQWLPAWSHQLPYTTQGLLHKAATSLYPVVLYGDFDSSQL